MIHDYSRRYATVNKGRGMSGRHYFAGQKEGRLGKAIGTMAVSSMILGIAVSFWFGWKIRTSLDDLSYEREVRQELTSVNRALVTESDRLKSRERIEKAAAGLGLHSPTARQLRRP